jgi:hypothetical protein
MYVVQVIRPGSDIASDTYYGPFRSQARAESWKNVFNNAMRKLWANEFFDEESQPYGIVQSVDSGPASVIALEVFGQER